MTELYCRQMYDMSSGRLQGKRICGETRRLKSENQWNDRGAWREEEMKEGSALRLGLSLGQDSPTTPVPGEGHSFTTSLIHRFVSSAGATLNLQSTVHKNWQTHRNTNMASFQEQLHSHLFCVITLQTLGRLDSLEKYILETCNRMLPSTNILHHPAVYL